MSSRKIKACEIFFRAIIFNISETGHAVKVNNNIKRMNRKSSVYLI